MHLQTLSQMAADLKAGRYSSTELVRSLLARITRAQPGLNAFISIEAEQALAAADPVGANAPGPKRERRFGPRPRGRLFRSGARKAETAPRGPGPRAAVAFVAELRRQRRRAPKGLTRTPCVCVCVCVCARARASH